MDGLTLLAALLYFYKKEVAELIRNALEFHKNYSNIKKYFLEKRRDS
jgi:hypothetical protein